jgi:tetratricopeptide (TPR) repeat protein
VTIVAVSVWSPGGKSSIQPSRHRSPVSTSRVESPHRGVQLLDSLLSEGVDGHPPKDIGLSNLLCASGLPGSEHLRIANSLATLDEWSQHVASETERHLYRLSDPRYADHYRHSEAVLRAELLVQVVQEDFGVHYDKRRIHEVDFRNSKDLFIHGMINDTNGGTCVSMPVLYVAVGRRLGYPLKLVLSREHVFCRWDGLSHAHPEWRERFNIEATDTGGMDSYPDAHYLNWPSPTSPAETAANGYLKSLSSSEELALFMATRGHCLLDNGRLQEAQVAYAHAHRLDPNRACYYHWLTSSVAQEMKPSGRQPASSLGQSLFQPRWSDDLHSVYAINEETRRLLERQSGQAIPVPSLTNQSIQPQPFRSSP